MGEAPTGAPHGPLVTWTGLDRDTGYLRVDTWIAGRGIDDALDAALAELGGRRR